MNHFMDKYFNKLMGDQQKVSKKKVPWWSYKVKQGDANYALRTDKINDYFDFDSDQNFQIEQHYQECCSGKKQFGDKYFIVGDMYGVKTSFKYHVWGTSKDPATWYEQNYSINGAPNRQLRRVIIDNA